MLGLLAFVVVARAHEAMRFLVYADAAIRYPFELDYGEGQVLNEIRLLETGRPIYHPLDAGPYTVGNYPPVFHLAAWLVDLVVRRTLAAGRIVSVASTALAALVIGALVWRDAGARASTATRALAAAVGGLSFLALRYNAEWGALARVDMLANVLALGGVLAFLAEAAREKRSYWSTIPFLLALYTKQSSVAAPAACFLVALATRPRWAWRWVTTLVATGGSLFVLIDLLTAGQFHFHLTTATRSAYEWRRTLSYLGDLVCRHAVELLVALGALLAWLRRGPRDPHSPRAVLGVFLLTALVVSLTVGKVGSHFYYFLELLGVVCVWLGIAVADALERSSDADRSTRGAVVAVALSAALAISAFGWLRPPETEPVEVPSIHRRREMDRLLDRIRRAEGPVLSKDMTLLVLAGKRIELQPFSMTQLAYQGLWDQGPFLRRIEAKEFALVVLSFDVRGPADPTLFTPQMVAAIRAGYREAGVAGDYWVYEPLTPPAAPR